MPEKDSFATSIGITRTIDSGDLRVATANPDKKGPNILGALMDFLILALLVGGAGFGGYYWGTTQRLAPVKEVAPGTPGALTAEIPSLPSSPAKDKEPSAPKQEEKDPVASSQSTPKDKSDSSSSSSTSTSSSSKSAASATKKSEKKKYWICSDGTEYIGYSITVSVNGTQVDNFFGPGKTVDITKNIKSGENTILFDAQALGDSYNKHKGDEKSILTLRVVSGPFIQENFKSSDVIVSYKRNAAQEESSKDTEHFVKD